MTSQKRLLTALAVGGGIGTVITVLLLLMLAVVIAGTGSVKPEFYAVLSVAAVCLGSLSGGYVCARVGKNKGLLLGIGCGAVIFLILTGIGAAVGGELTAAVVLRGAAALIAAAIGGVLGVNKKRRRR